LTFAAHGVHGATIIVAGTAQNTNGVLAVEAFSPRFVARQIDAVFTDLAPAAVKIGMLFDARHRASQHHVSLTCTLGPQEQSPSIGPDRSPR
jgi:hydroxymethylpyrimidine/phosphomethylpyrimidine kinase